MHSFYYLAPKRFGTVAILRELTPGFNENTQQYLYCCVFLWHCRHPQGGLRQYFIKI